tara:strand:+ start:3972 stop:4163 length:192 start_codon:yes stop_codon:yes gene_type:complete
MIKIANQISDRISNNQWELDMLEEQIEMGLTYRSTHIEKLRELEAENKAYNNVLRMISEEENK